MEKASNTIVTTSNSAELKLLFGFGSAILLVITISVLTSYYTGNFLEANKWVEHTKDVLYESEQTVSAAKDIALKNNGYVLTGDSNFIKQTQRAAADAQLHLNRLKQLTSDNPAQQKMLDSLGNFIRQRVEFSEVEVNVRNQFGRDSALAVLTGPTNKRHLQVIRDEISRLQDAESLLLRQREQQTAKNASAFKSILYLLMVGIIALLVFVFLTVRYALKALREAEAKTNQLNSRLEQKVSERTEEIRKTNQLFKAVVENTYEMVSLADENFKVTYRSPAAYRLTGYTPQEMDALDGAKQVHPDDLPAMGPLRQNVMNNPGLRVPFSFRFPHKDGHYLWVEGTMTNLLHDKNINSIVINTRDVTAGKQAEEALRISEGRLSAILEQFPLPIIIYAASGDTISANHAWEVMWQDKLENVTGYNIRKDPQMIASGLSVYIEQAFAGEVALSPPYQYDPALIGKIGRKRWIQMLLFPYKNEKDEVLEVVLILQDITFNKEAEEKIKHLNEELELKVKDRTARLEVVNKELEAFSYSVSHDLRAPLRAINGYARMLKEDQGKVLNEDGLRLLGVIRENAAKMGTLIDDLLSFSRLGRQDIKRTRVDMNEVFRNALHEINKNMEHNATISICELPVTMGDSSLLSMAVINLLANAIKYSSGTENPYVEVTVTQQNDEHIFKVSDNGAGFEMEYVKKLFNVFQRLHTNDEFEGTGVGLAIVKRIVEKHKGRVWAEGEVNKGASFYFTMPYIDNN